MSLSNPLRGGGVPLVPTRRRQNALSRRLIALSMHPFVLIAVPAVFMAVFFLLPLFSILQQSVRDTALSDALPSTAALLRQWDGETQVPASLQQALVRELQEHGNTPELSRLPFRLNQEISGFRSLISATGRRLEPLPDNQPVNLTDIDARWGEARYWQALKAASGPFTSRYLLAALDLTRTGDGELTWLPEHQRIQLLYLVRTFWVSFWVTLACIMIGYPLACAMAVAPPWGLRLMMLGTLIPFWTSLLVRTSAWVVLLRQDGVVNNTLAYLGLIDRPLDLIFNRAGLYVAMVHILLPFLVLPLYAVVKTIPRNQMWAAAALGASPAIGFLKVFLPQSVPGIVAGGLIVFILSTGFYVTPALVGGRGDQMTSALIEQFAFADSNWAMAASIALILLTTVALLVGSIWMLLRVLRPELKAGRAR